MVKPFPKAIKVGPVTYTTEVVDGLSDTNNIALWGRCDHDTLVLSVAKKVDLQFQKIVLLHEILHAVYHLSGLPDPVTEEQMITSISPLLVLLMRDNPKLLEYLCEK